MKIRKTFLSLLACTIGVSAFAEVGAVSETTAGVEMLTEASHTALYKNHSYFSPLLATATAPAGFRVVSEARLDPIYKVGAFMPTQGAVEKGDLLVLTMQIRGTGSSANSAKILFKLQDRTWYGVIREEIPAKEQWQSVRYIGVANKDYSDGALNLSLIHI